MYKDASLRRFQYYVNTTWSGGVYASGLVFNVDVLPDRSKQLGLKSGDTAHLFPKDHVAGPDYSI